MMLRRLAYYGFAVLAVLLCNSCDRTLESDWDGPVIELTLSCGESGIATKAGLNGTKDGVDYYNENLIETVDFFFYPYSGQEPSRDINASYHIKLPSGQRGSDVFRIELTSEQVNTLIFPSALNIVKSYVLAVVNYPGTLVADENNLDGTTIEQIEAKRLSADFVSPADHRQNNFLMGGSTSIFLRSRALTMAAIGSIELERYACKMTVGLKVADRIEFDNGEVWSPMLESMEIYMVDVVNSVRLGGEDITSPTYFSYSSNRKKFVNKDAQGNYTPTVGVTSEGYYSTYPMYMYPQRWEYGSSSGNDREPYLKLVVPWVRLAENGYSTMQKQLYYKIVMPEDTRDGYRRRFVRNNWYHMDIDVGIFGAETDEAAVTLPTTVYIVDWQNDDEIVKKSEIGSARYLSVEKQTYELHNENSVTVKYTTSHPAIIKPGSITVTRPYYGEKTSGSDLGGVVRAAGDGTYYLEFDEAHRRAMTENHEDWFENTGTGIIYTHVLQNDFRQPSFEYSPYTVTFTIVHEDRPNDVHYAKDISIVQYPAIFIEATRNSDDSFVYLGPGTYNRLLYSSDHWGYVYVDNEQLVRGDERDLNYWSAYYGYTDKEDFHWRAIWYTGGSRDIFKMNITVLPEDSEYSIGDPRSKTVDNLRDDFKEAPALYGTSPRRLRWYYPTENSDRTANMMAPSYRIASKCGGVEFDGITMEQARYRCASYQEDGFPAGRWRIPTKAEIHFIAQLSANGAFTYLFSNVVYWSANGAIRVNKANGSVTDVGGNVALVRCVYDTWYWGDDQQDNREQFVWGDKAR